MCNLYMFLLCVELFFKPAEQIKSIIIIFLHVIRGVVNITQCLFMHVCSPDHST